MEQRRRERRERTKRSFAALATRYMEGHAKKRKRTWAEDARLLNKHVLPLWQYRRADQLSRQDVIELVDGVVAAGAPIEGNRLQSLLSTIFSFALDEGSISAHPSIRLKRRGGEEKPRQRLLSTDEIAVFWPEITKSPVSMTTGLCLRLALLTSMRAGEVAGICRSEIVGLGGPEPYILLPGSRVKTRLPHLVPLVGLSVEVVDEALRRTKLEWLFPGRWRDRSLARARGLRSRLGSIRGNRLDEVCCNNICCDAPRSHRPGFNVVPGPIAIR